MLPASWAEAHSGFLAAFRHGRLPIYDGDAGPSRSFPPPRPTPLASVFSSVFDRRNTRVGEAGSRLRRRPRGSGRMMSVQPATSQIAMAVRANTFGHREQIDDGHRPRDTGDAAIGEGTALAGAVACGRNSCLVEGNGIALLLVTPVGASGSSWSSTAPWASFGFSISPLA